MKKILTHLTGIVFLITILAAGGCNSNNKQNDQTAKIADSEQVVAPAKVQADSTKVEIFLKEIKINGIVHLEMYDSKKEECKVIDSHLIVVRPGYTVKWKNTPGSEIDDIIQIRTVGGDGTFFGALPEIDSTEVDSTKLFRMGTLKLEIPESATPDTLIKYKIVFTLKKDSNIYTIDPYLEIPDHPLRDSIQ